jgi:hypothetical protein
VVRDHGGVVQATCSTTKTISAEANVAEALAAIRTVEFCRAMSFFDIIREGMLYRLSMRLIHEARIGATWVIL